MAELIKFPSIENIHMWRTFFPQFKVAVNKNGLRSGVVVVNHPAFISDESSCKMAINDLNKFLHEYKLDDYFFAHLTLDGIVLEND